MFQPNEVVTLEISLVSTSTPEARSRLPRLPELGPPPPVNESSARQLSRASPSPRFRSQLHRGACARISASRRRYLQLRPQSLGTLSTRLSPLSAKRRVPLHAPRWFDPFNRNRFKGDEPIWPELLGQQTFLNITASAETFFDGRRVPSPSGVSAAQPGSSGFFGRGEQAFFDQTLRFSFDLFHGDASFKPVDWRIRITPELSLNDLDVRERGIVSPDVRHGTNRFDDHFGLQEAFVEVKLARP